MDRLGTDYSQADLHTALQPPYTVFWRPALHQTVKDETLQVIIALWISNPPTMSHLTSEFTPDRSGG